MAAPNSSPATEGPAGFLGSSPGKQGYQPACPLCHLEKGEAEQGTRSLCSPALPSLSLLSSRPISGSH